VKLKATQSQPPLVGDQLHCGGQVERTVAGRGRDAQAGVAAIDVGVAQAVALGAKNKRHPVRRGGRRGPLRLHPSAQMLARGQSGRAKVARRHGGGAQVRDAAQGLVERGAQPRRRQHVGGAAGALQRLGALQHIGPARPHQHQIGKTHHLERTRHRPHIASVAGLDQNKAADDRLVVHGLNEGVGAVGELNPDCP